MTTIRVGSTALPTTGGPRRSRRRPTLLVLVAGLVLGGLAGLLLGPHSLAPGPRTSGDPALAAEFRRTLAGDRGLASVEVARLRAGRVTYAGLAPAVRRCRRRRPCSSWVRSPRP